MQVMDIFEKAEVKYPYGAAGPAKKAAKPPPKEKSPAKAAPPKKEAAKKPAAKKPAAKKGTVFFENSGFQAWLLNGICTSFC